MINPRRNPINISKGTSHGTIRGFLPSNSILPLAAAADPTTGKVWVYYTDINKIVNNAWTKDGGLTWASGDAINAQITLDENHVMSAYFDPNYSEPRIVLTDCHENCLCEAYNDDGSWVDDYIHP